MQTDDTRQFPKYPYFSHTLPRRTQPTGMKMTFDRGGKPLIKNKVHEAEYARRMDMEVGKATKVWEFRPFPDEFSRILSSARRLPNGNTLTMFGAATVIPLQAYEVKRDGTVVWFLEVRNADSIYRANAVTDIAGEVVVTDATVGAFSTSPAAK